MKHFEFVLIFLVHKKNNLKSRKEAYKVDMESRLKKFDLARHNIK